MKRPRCPYCREHSASLGFAFALGGCVGAFLLAVACAAAWPGLFA